MITENNDSPDIETKIIEAANNVFLKYGVDKSTMGQIADEAGISRTSLNYYFRSKNHLVQKVLNNIENKIIPTISILINDENMPLIVKIELFVDEYIDLVTKYPMVPSFILWELTREPNWIIQFFKERNLNFEILNIEITEEVKMGNVIPFKLEDLFVNILGLCAFPFVSKPLLMEFFFDQNEEKLFQFMISRKTEVKRILRNWLKPD
ncbi:MAG: TetR/AcrR family transcriptional regulator [Candidatus Eremiobacterota bacterium]